MATNSRQSTLNLILVPAIIALAITILRVVGELHHWSPAFFNTAAGGGGALVGISWLPFVFGIYFALKLINFGEAPTNRAKPVLMMVLGLVLIIGTAVVVGKPTSLNQFLPVLVALIIAAIIQYFGWPQLAKTFFVYGLATRIPTVIVYYLAFTNHWGTHYDAINPDLAKALKGYSTMRLFINEGLIPQLFMWIPITIFTGSITGSITALIASFRTKRNYSAARTS